MTGVQHPQQPQPQTVVEAADLADKYDQMLRLADVFDDAGAQMREWAQLGHDVLTDSDVTDSAVLSPTSWTTAEEEIRAASSGKAGLLSRSIELDADALVLRATVITYRWIDDLQAAAYETLGSIAGKAIGFLAPEVDLGGAVVAAGLIETDALDRDGVAAYLGELAEAHPELMDHVTTGGGLLDSLQMRGLLTAGVLAGETGHSARAGGLRATGIAPFADDWAAALRDVAGETAESGAATDSESASPDDASPEHAAPEHAAPAAGPNGAPGGLEDLIRQLTESDTAPVRVLQVSADRFVAFLTPGALGSLGPTQAAGNGRLRLVSGDPSRQAAMALRAITAAVEAAPADPDRGLAQVLLVGRGHGGAIATEIARHGAQETFEVVQVVTTDAPATQLTALQGDVPVLSLEDRNDPVALLGSLVNAHHPHLLTVVYDASPVDGVPAGLPAVVAGARAADRSDHPELVAVRARWRAQGFLTA